MRIALIERCYAAFKARGLDAALAGMHADVDWPNPLDGAGTGPHD